MRELPLYTAGRARRATAQFAAAGAMCVLIYAASRFMIHHPGTNVVEGVKLLALGLPLLWLALWLHTAAPSASFVYAGDAGHAAPMISGRLRWLRRSAIGLGAGGMFILTEVNVRLGEGKAPDNVPHQVQLVLLVVSCAMLIWGFADRPLRLAGWSGQTPARRVEIALVAGLTTFALIIRLHDLEALRTVIDEVNFLMPMWHFNDNPSVPILQPMGRIGAFPYLYPYLQWLSNTFTESTLIAARIPAAIFGGLTVPALYLLAKHLCNKHVAFTAAALLATLPVHVHWSRLGMNNVADPLFGVLMFGLLLRGSRRGGAWHFAAAGVCLGLTQYFYEAGRLVFPGILLIWLLYFMLFTVWRRLPRRYILIFLFTGFVVGAPVYATLLNLNRPLTPRLEQTRSERGSWRSNDLAELARHTSVQLTDMALLFVSNPEVDAYYGGRYPYVQVYLLPALLLGLGVLVWRLRSPTIWLLVLWLLLPALGIAAFLQINSSSRILMVFPALMIVCALGIVEPLRLLLDNRRQVVRVVVPALVLVVCGLHVTYYFALHIDAFTRQNYAWQPDQEVLFLMRDLPPGLTAYYVSDAPYVSGRLPVMMSALKPSTTIHVISRGQAKSGYFDSIQIEPGLIFFLDRSDQETYDLLHDRFIMRGPTPVVNRFAPPDYQYDMYITVDARSAMW